MRKTTLFLIILAAWSISCFGQSFSKTINVNGQVRNYRIFIPPGYQPGQLYSLVFALHGLGDNANNFQNVGFNSLADTANFIAIYPEGLPDPVLGGNAWNVGLNPANSTPDIAFMTALLDTVQAEYNIDSMRIYFCGFSMGGFMSYRVACELGEKVAAIASVAGTLPSAIVPNCSPGGVMPVMHIHGTNDQTIAYTNAPIYGIIPNLGADSSARYWARHNSCDFPPAHDTLPDTHNDGLLFERFWWNLCSDSSEVILIRANNMTHIWPGANNDFNATREIWKFFSRHRNRLPADTVGIITPAKATPFSIFPNPAKDRLFLKIENGGYQTAIIRDVTGKAVLPAVEVASPATTIDIHGLPEGVYLLELTGTNHKRAARFVKLP